MKGFLRVLAVLLAAVAVFAAARYMDNKPEMHSQEIAGTQAAVSNQETEQSVSAEQDTEPEETTLPQEQRLTFTFAGDCTLGGHAEHVRAGYGFLMTVGEDYDYPFQYVREWFESDDFTMVNLEGALSNVGRPSGARYSFRGPEEYVNILTGGSVEAVTLANNHAYDYGEQGYNATKAVLEANNIDYVEKDKPVVITLDSGVTVGFYATVYNSVDKEATVRAIQELSEQDLDLIIYAPHWGTEHSFRPTQEQMELGRAAIDAGADIVYGCHAHVLQPIEEYNDGVIYYSLGNFSFGGNIYPSDYDTAIIQQEIILAGDGTVTLGERTIIPCSISSMEKRNNFQPIPYEEGSEEYLRVLSKLDGSYSGSNLPVH